MSQRTEQPGQHASQPIPTKTASSGGPDSPFELSKRDWKATLKRVGQEFKSDRVPLVAAGMAFYWFLAVFPALIAAVGTVDLLGLGPQLLASINNSIGSTIPSSAARLLTDTIDAAQNASRGSSLAAATVGIAVALWGATAGMVALQQGLDVAYDVAEKRKFFKARGVAVIMVLATGSLGALPSLLFASRNPIISVLGWFATLAAVMTLLALFYYLGPNREKPNWRWVSPGGMVGAVLFLLISAGFSIYVTNFATYGETYGALASVVVLLFWLYLTGIAIMLGGELNAELERQTAMREGRA